MYPAFLSTIVEAPVSYCVYSTMSFYGRRRGGELPGLWFVRAFSRLGHEPAATRQTLFRMVRSGELQARRAGREKYYRLSPWALAEADAGLAKILGPSAEGWDGQWTLVHARFEAEEESHRERLYELLRAEGFARLGWGAFIHPRNRAARVLEAAASEGIEERIVIVRGERQGEPVHQFVNRIWDVDALAAEYRAFLVRFGRVSRRRSDYQAFLLRYAVVISYLEVAWRDPELPLELLPDDWPGPSARSLAARLYRELLPGAIRFADGIGRPALPRSTGRTKAR